MSKDKDYTPIGEEIKKAAVDVKDEPLEFINESIMSVNWKLKILMFLLFMLICSTMFINDVVAKFGSDTIRDQYSTNNKGTIIQGILFVLIYSLFETLIKSKVL